MKGSQRKYLRALAHNYKPQVIVGKKALTEGSINSISTSLEANELIKVKFSEKKCMLASKNTLEDKLDCHIVGDIGKILILYKKNFEKTENNIVIPN